MGFVVGAGVLAMVTALACALPGVFVVLRKSSMLVDGITHAVFPGIVVGYYFTHNLDSPLLIIGAALAGLAVVLGAEWLRNTGLLSGDAPQGLVFPALFSIGVLLVTANFSNIHLDTHMVLVGDINLASLDHLYIGEVSIGPTYMYVMALILCINIAFIAVNFRALKASTFDAQFASILGIKTKLLNTAFMFLVAVTVTATFNAAGAILTIALVVAPAAAAFLISTRLDQMIALTMLISGLGAVLGFWVAYKLDASTSAAMALFYGLCFFGILTAKYIYRKNKTQKKSQQPGF